MKWNFIPILVDEFWSFSVNFWWICFRSSWIFSENDEMSRDVDKNCQKNAEKGRKFWNLCQISFVHFICSIVSLMVNDSQTVFRWKFQILISCCNFYPNFISRLISELWRKWRHWYGVTWPEAMTCMLETVLCPADHDPPSLQWSSGILNVCLDT